jgi:septum formation protein
VSCDLVRRLIAEHPLILASASPRRARILKGLDVDFVLDPSLVPEEPLSGEAPEEHVERLAWAKASSVAARHRSGTVLGADTIVVLDGNLLGKPRDPEDAARMLRAIRGRWHDVVTGLALVRRSDGAGVVGHERSRVLVRDLTDADIEDYVRGGEPLDKAGSYGIQECGAAVVERVEGCFYNVVGLPVARLCRLLQELGCRPQGPGPAG